MAGFRRSRLRNSLVVAQVSLSIVLLLCAGLIVRSLQAAQKMRPGFNPESAVALSFSVVLQGYDEARGRAFYKQVLERAAALPQVQSVASPTICRSAELQFDHRLHRRHPSGQQKQHADRDPILDQPRLLRGDGHSAPRPRFPDG
jgi:hypothetical protein